jgi:phage virion morphogenesis protein
MEITIKTDGADAVREYLKGIADRVGNMSPIMKAIGDRVAEQTKRRFEKGGPAPDGTPWAKVKKPHPKARGILRISDHLKDSIRFQMIDNNTVAIGTNKVYAAIHQLGGKTGPHDIVPVRKKAIKTPFGLFRRVKHPGSQIPARPYLGLSRSDSDEIIGIINEHIMGR